MKAIITKLQDMQPLYLDATKESYIMKLETNKYVIVHSFFDNELRIIDLLELKWFLKECKDDQAITDLVWNISNWLLSWIAFCSFVILSPLTIIYSQW